MKAARITEPMKIEIVESEMPEVKEGQILVRNMTTAICGSDMPHFLHERPMEYPLEPVFRAGQVSLGYDEVSKRLVVIAYELQDEDDESQPSVARFWATPAQMRAFSIHGQDVVAAGRPKCSMCGEPIEPEGHFCPRKNGNRT